MKSKRNIGDKLYNFFPYTSENRQTSPPTFAPIKRAPSRRLLSVIPQTKNTAPFEILDHCLLIVGPNSNLLGIRSFFHNISIQVPCQ